MFHRFVVAMLHSFIVAMLRRFVVAMLHSFIVAMLRRFVVAMLHSFVVAMLRRFVVAMLHSFVVAMLRRFVVAMLHSFIASLLRRFRNQFSKNDSEPGTNKRVKSSKRYPLRPRSPSFALIGPYHEPKKSLPLQPGELPIRYRGFRMESRCPRQLLFIPWGRILFA